MHIACLLLLMMSNHI